MKETDYNKMVAMKLNVQLAYEEFQRRYGKVPKGIENLMTMILLSNKPGEIEMLSGRFFGYIFKSLNAKKLRQELDDYSK